MRTNNTIVITIAGPVGSGKTIALRLIKKALEEQGYKCEVKAPIYFTETLVASGQ